jgi:hypothetical protein
MVSFRFGPWNGRVPVSISYWTQDTSKLEGTVAKNIHYIIILSLKDYLSTRWKSDFSHLGCETCILLEEVYLLRHNIM